MCPSCGAESQPGARFCGSCGSALDALRCPSCGAPNPDGNRFCGQCGATLAEGDAGMPARPSGLDERKLATVLFADVVGFTSLAEDSDPETVARMVDGAFRRMARVVTDH